MRNDDVHYVIEPPRQVNVAIPGYNPLGILTTIHAAFEKKRQHNLEKKRRRREEEARIRRQQLDNAQDELQALNEALLQHATVPHQGSVEVDFQDTVPASQEELHSGTTDDVPWFDKSEGIE